MSRYALECFDAAAHLWEEAQHLRVLLAARGEQLSPALADLLRRVRDLLMHESERLTACSAGLEAARREALPSSFRTSAPAWTGVTPERR